jgi:hypothetical protein
LVGNKLNWRNTIPESTPFSRLLIGGIRGEQNSFGDLDNLIISAVVTAPPSEDFSLIDPKFSLANFSFSFQTQSNREYLIESTGNFAPPD